MNDTRVPMLARILLGLAIVCGVIGLVAGFTDHQWKLSVVGWFTGGGLLALVSIALMTDAYTSRS